MKSLLISPATLALFSQDTTVYISTEQTHKPISYNFRMLISPPFPGVVNIGIPVLVAILTVPTLKHLLARKRSLARGYEPVGGDVAGTAHYQDRNGEATEASTKAFRDFRSMLTLWLGVLINLGASITVELMAYLNFKGSRMVYAQALVLDTPRLSSWGEIVLAVCTYSSRLNKSQKSLTQLFRAFCICNAPFFRPKATTEQDFI